MACGGGDMEEKHLKYLLAERKHSEIISSVMSRKDLR